MGRPNGPVPGRKARAWPNPAEEPRRRRADNRGMAAALVDPILLPAFVLPLALALLARHRALHAPDALEARWFAFARRVDELPYRI